MGSGRLPAPRASTRDDPATLRARSTPPAVAVKSRGVNLSPHLGLLGVMGLRVNEVKMRRAAG